MKLHVITEDDPTGRSSAAPPSAESSELWKLPVAPSIHFLTASYLTYNMDHMGL
jgi:hypothetical protein